MGLSLCWGFFVCFLRGVGVWLVWGLGFLLLLVCEKNDGQTIAELFCFK